MSRSVSYILVKADRPWSGSLEDFEHDWGLDKAFVRYFDVDADGGVLGTVWVQKSDLAKLSSTEAWPSRLRMTLEEM